MLLKETQCTLGVTLYVKGMKALFFVILMIYSGISLIGQDHFLVELEKFTPPEKDVIRSLKGFPAENFLAKDLDGEEHFLGSYKDQAKILWFWSKDDPISMKWLPAINLLQLKYLDHLKVFGFGKEDKIELTQAISNEAVIFPNFPNGAVFGEAAYGGDLGYGRMFFIDRDGIIKEVLPRSFFTSHNVNDATPIVEKIIEKIAY